MGDRTAFEVGRLYPLLKTIADTLTASQKDVFVRLPGLLGYWPMSIRFPNGQAAEHAGTGFALSQTGLCPAGYDGNSFAHLGDGTNYLSSTASLGVTGLETYVTSSLRGLTLGGWFMIDASGVGDRGLVSKDGVTPNRGYGLFTGSADTIGFYMSNTGAALLVATGPAVTLGQWHFVVGRFTPSAEVAVIVDGNKTVNVTAIPASVFVSTQAFEVGRFTNDNSTIVHGKVRDLFICATALSDALIEQIRATSMP